MAHSCHQATEGVARRSVELWQRASGKLSQSMQFGRVHRLPVRKKEPAGVINRSTASSQCRKLRVRCSRDLCWREWRLAANP